ncbi:MAG: 5-formyltetrahydrofolate cyclo-ligase [Kiritimatiellae bacterium]|nr:5-formyltetrahydrofolate cyclo-ligase [Kiritimatiellia bacterium]
MMSGTHQENGGLEFSAITERKDAIRQEMRERRHEIRRKERIHAGLKIALNLNIPPLDIFMRSHVIAVYLSAGHEIPMRFLISTTWRFEKMLCVPAWDELMKEYALSEFQPGMELVPGRFGIREPFPQIPVSPWEVNTFVIPGLAFDKVGGRLGYGAGYYDRILKNASKAALRVGVCYDWQILDEPLPQDENDVRLDWVVSERRIVNCKTGEAQDVSDLKGGIP